MALWDADDLVLRCQDMAGRPDSDQDMTAAKWCRRLTEAQAYWYRVFASHCPEVLFTAPALLTRAADGLTYTFPAGTGTPLAVQLRSGRQGPLLVLGTDYDDAADAVLEGDTVRMPHGKERTFSNGIYGQWVIEPGAIDTESSPSLEPTLQPESARILLVYHACGLWASQGGYRDPAYYWALEQRAAWGDPNSPGDVGVLGSLKRQGFGSGVAHEAAGDTRWWSGIGG